MRRKAKTISCRFCGWKTALWTTSRNGERSSGWAKLRRHVADNHWDAWQRLQAWLGDEVA